MFPKISWLCSSRAVALRVYGGLENAVRSWRTTSGTDVLEMRVNNTENSPRRI